MIKRLLLLLFLAPIFSFAQTAGGYCFTATSGAYATLTAATDTSLSATDDDKTSNTINLPFTFTFAGTAYTQIKVCSNGWLTFGSTNSTEYRNTASNAGTIGPVLMPLWDDLANSLKPRYVISGVSPNRIFKLEWSKQKWDYQSGVDVISFQVWLYESTNVVEYSYSQGSTGMNGTPSATIGIYDAAGTYLTLNNSGVSPTAQPAIFTTNISTKPEDGQIYRFSPPPTTPISTAGTSITCSGATANWGASASATSYLLDVSTVSTFASFVSGYNGLDVGSAVKYNVSGLTGGTVYYYRVRATNSCGTSVNSSNKSFTTSSATSTSWNGSAWDNGAPTYAKNIVFNGNYSLSSSIDACSCTINSGNIVINTGNTLTIAGGITISAGTLTLDNNSSLIQLSNVLNTSNVTVKRNTTPIVLDDYTYWSSPTSGSQTLLNFSPNTQADKFFVFNNNWASVNASTTSFTPGVGYSIRSPEGISSSIASNVPFQFTGVPNNGTIPVAVTAILDASGQAGLRLVGNPYPSAIDADAFIDANVIGTGTVSKTITGTLYFWTHNHTLSGNDYLSTDYATYTKFGGTGTAAALSGSGNNSAPTKYIASGQGFFVEVDAPGNVTFNNAMRGAANNTNFYKTATKKSTLSESHRVWLNLANNSNNFSQALVGYSSMATNDYDPGFDGISFGSEVFSLYSLQGSDELTIQARTLPFVDTDIVPLGYAISVAGNTTISIDHVDGLFLDAQNIYLEDKLLNVVHDIKAKSYNFESAVGTFNDRFVLRYTDKTLGTGTFDLNENSIIISKDKNELKIQSELENIKRVTVFDLLGRKVFDKVAIDSNEFQTSNITLNKQTVLVKVTLTDGKVVTKKVIY